MQSVEDNIKDTFQLLKNRFRSLQHILVDITKYIMYPTLLVEVLLSETLFKYSR